MGDQFSPDIKVSIQSKGFESRQLSRWILTYQSINDKCIASCVEALIGAYLVECGKKGAVLFMQWLGFDLRSKSDIPHKNTVSIDSTRTRTSHHRVLVKIAVANIPVRL